MSEWDRLVVTNEEREKIWSRNRSFGEDVWFRFRQKPTALAGLIIVGVLLLFSLLGPFFSPYDYSDQQLSLANISPLLQVCDAPDGHFFHITQAMKVIELDENHRLIRQLTKIKDDAVNKRIAFEYDEKTQVILDYSQKPIAMLNASGERTPANRSVWNGSYLLGTDHLGRDILTRLMYGTRISLAVAFIAALVNMVIGILYGGISGYAGGRTDQIMMRFVDIIATIPLTLYVVLVKMLLDNGMASIIIALSSVYWVDMARVVRGQVLGLKQQEFVLAAKTLGSSTKTILLSHLVPNSMGPILVTVTMLIPSAIFMEAFMSFIGIGIAPPMASLGTMCNDATENLRSNPYQLLMPALTICLVMFAFNFVGDGLRDALDPKLKK